MTENKMNNEEKAEVLPLYWMDRLTGARQKAGVGFYENNYGEYRLKIDFLSMLQERPPNVFLRPVAAENDETYFVAEAVIRVNGKTVARKPIGDGYSVPASGEIHVKLGPFEKILVVTFSDSFVAMKKAS